MSEISIGKLSKLARVEFETSRADVVVSKASPPNDSVLVQAVEKAGFSAHVHD